MTTAPQIDCDSATSKGPSTRPRRRWRKALSIAAVAVLVVLTAGAWAANEYGPRHGFYLFAPSPERYAELALDVMDDGYYASGPRWDEERARVHVIAVGASSIGELHEPLAAAARVAGGKHSFFLDPAKAERSNTRAATEFNAPTITSADGVTTVTVPAVGPVSTEMQQRYAHAAADGIASAAATTCAWIVDLRGNTGGTMYPMLTGLAPLLPNGTAMTFRTREAVDTAVSIADDGAGIDDVVVPIEGMSKVAGQPIAVLQDGDTASSGEAVLTAFRGLDNVRSFGSDSAGYSSANSVHPLYDGARLVLTTSVYVDRDGRSVDEQPIEPNSRTAPEDTIDAARQWLHDNGCNR